MSLQNFSYFFFFLITICVYLQLPKKAQTPFLLLASIVFYGKNLFTSYENLCTAGTSTANALFSCGLNVALVTFMAVFVWRAALAIDACRRAGAAATTTQSAAWHTARKASILRISIIALLVLLALFKYYNLSPLPTIFDGSVLASLPVPLGASFFTLAAIGYLIDVSRGKYDAETKFIHVTVFLFFFATLTSGPICRGNQILPQLHQAHRFDETRTVQALRLFALGLFKKIAVADVLGLMVDEVFGSYANYGGLMLLFMLPCYLIQLYFDFSGYSELSRASGMFLGIQIPENFKTPFFSTNFTEIWSRWHISLSSWLRDYVYIPLGGNRLGDGRRICNIAIVFFISGLWHGNTLPFVLWGILHTILRTSEEFLPQQKRIVSPPSPTSLRQWCKRAWVFAAWSFCFGFFRIGSDAAGYTLADCWFYLVGMGQNLSPTLFITQLNSAIAAGFYQNQMLQIAYLLFIAFTLCISFYLDAMRFFVFADKPSEAVLAAQKPAVKWALYYILILCIFAGLIMQNGGFAGGSFAYAQY